MNRGYIKAVGEVPSLSNSLASGTTTIAHFAMLTKPGFCIEGNRAKRHRQL